jgi:hypothetical protein
MTELETRLAVEHLKDSLVGIIALGVVSSLIATFIWQKYQDSVGRLIITVFGAIFLLMALFVWQHWPKDSNTGEHQQTTTTPAGGFPIVGEKSPAGQTGVIPASEIPILPQDPRPGSNGVGKAPQTQAPQTQARPAQTQQSVQPAEERHAPPSDCSLLGMLPNRSGAELYQYGVACEFGTEHLSKDIQSAINFYRRAAASSDPVASKQAKESLERLGVPLQ